MLELTENEQWPFASALIALGVDRQCFTYQSDADVLNSMAVYVDGQLAWSIRLNPVRLM